MSAIELKGIKNVEREHGVTLSVDRSQLYIEQTGKAKEVCGLPRAAATRNRCGDMGCRRVASFSPWAWHRPGRSVPFHSYLPRRYLWPACCCRLPTNAVPYCRCLWQVTATNIIAGRGQCVCRRFKCVCGAR